ncbi:MAG TPA: class I SAM-dependent methyltransferase [Thermoanaerobaculia bacterium]|nr:class I SAM-dependent methyltransferase [Thermoanaerobaculia bacterium]HQP87550.1 class I SAM-dependent methyltransferase [Thermoanaerobaculia bacterium]
MGSSDPRPGDATPRLYRDLAEWYPLLTPVEDYPEEAAFYRRLFETYAARPPRTLLDLGCGAGHVAFHLKASLEATLVDLSPSMLALSRRLNPDCEHVEGDMRSVRLGRLFDAVLLHDAVSHMTTRGDVAAAVATAFAHTAPGGVALFQPDCVAETFAEETGTGGSDGGGRGLRYLEWRFRPEPEAERFVVEMAYLLREAGGEVRVAQDRLEMGLFPRAYWLETLAAAGFEALVVPLEHSAAGDYEVFVGRRPVR